MMKRKKENKEKQTKTNKNKQTKRQGRKGCTNNPGVSALSLLETPW